MQYPAHNPAQLRPSVVPVRNASRLSGPPPLPIPPTPLFGRDAEVETALALLARPDVRLLTLTGPGGVGKTRLAIHIARLIQAQFSMPTWFVPLATVRQVEHAVAAIAAGLGIRDSRQFSPATEITRLLGENEALLVLDNFEQVVAAAPDIADLLTCLPKTKTIVTSREPLRISGEHVLPVPCLRSPDAVRRHTAAEIADLSAVKLFAARAEAAAPGFRLDDETATAVAAICRRLDGLPLAIELAATWIRIFPPQDLLRLLGSRLPLLSNGPRDLPERQQTMRAAIDWSHDLIPPVEQVYFRRLAVFHGGFPLEAATVVDPDADAESEDQSPTLLIAISDLVDKNLIQRAGDDGNSPRFSMLEMVREYALERFATDSEATAVRTRHARWFLTFAEQTEARWQIPGGGSISEFLPEYDNLRAALSWFEESGDADSMLRLAAALGSFWMHMGHLREGLDWLERAVALGTRRNAPTDRISMAISWQGVLSTAAGDKEGARVLLERALALRRDTESWEGEAHTLRHLGLLHIASGDLDTAEVRLSRSEELFRLHQHDAGRSMVLDLLAEIAYIRGDLDTAARSSAEAVDVARRSGNRMRIALALVGSAQVDVLHRKPERAMTSLREAGALALDIGFRFGLADVIACAASILGPRSDPARAVRLLSAATAIRESLSLDHHCHDEQYRRTLAASHDWLDAESYGHAWEQGSQLVMEAAVAEALDERSSVAGAATAGAPPSELSPREREVLALLAEGRSNPEIADELSISRKTVAVHVSHILNRLGVESRSAAVAVAIRANLV